METGSYSDRIDHRFRELILRDPLMVDYLRSRQKWINEHPSSTDFPPEGIPLWTKICEKWSLPFAVAAPGNTDLYFQKTRPVVTEHKAWREVPSGEAVISVADDKGNLFNRQPGHLYLDIDLSTLDMADARRIKVEVWEFLKPRIQERKRDVRRQKGWNPPVQKGDPPELAWVYQTKENTFYKYLRWYDIHRQEKLGFRIIAFMEAQGKHDPARIEKVLEQVKNMPRIPQVGTPVPGKNKVTVRGEDAVEKGVKRIHLTIHRTPYNRTDSMRVFEQYDCPKHGKGCPKDCQYLSEWHNRFNRAWKI